MIQVCKYNQNAKYYYKGLDFFGLTFPFPPFCYEEFQQQEVERVIKWVLIYPPSKINN